MTLFSHNSRQSILNNTRINDDGIALQSQLLLCPFSRFYSDEGTWGVDRQFLWGPGLLISAVIDQVGLAIFMFVSKKNSVGNRDT